jgi:hypothetical protein
MAPEERGPATPSASRRLPRRRLPYPTDDEDVVVGAEREQENGNGERNVVGELAGAQERLKDPRGDTEAGGEGERAGSEEVERRNQCPQENDKKNQVDEEDRDADPDEILNKRPDRLGRKGGLASEAELGVGNPGFAQEPRHTVA